MCLKPFRDWSPHYVPNGLFGVELYTFNIFDSTDTRRSSAMSRHRRQNGRR
jgi:hypothetical protein